jgi:hypothetical protein
MFASIPVFKFFIPLVCPRSPEVIALITESKLSPVPALILSALFNNLCEVSIEPVTFNNVLKGTLRSVSIA